MIMGLSYENCLQDALEVVEFPSFSSMDDVLHHPFMLNDEDENMFISMRYTCTHDTPKKPHPPILDSIVILFQLPTTFSFEKKPSSFSIQ